MFLADRPVGVEEASGDLLIVGVRDDLDLTFYEVHEDTPDGWQREWLLPAELINSRATVRRATQEEWENA